MTGSIAKFEQQKSFDQDLQPLQDFRALLPGRLARHQPSDPQSWFTCELFGTQHER